MTNRDSRPLAVAAPLACREPGAMADSGHAAWRLMCLAALAVLVLAGCNGKDNGDGPILEKLPRGEVVYRYNRRARLIETLKAKAHVEARFPKMDSDGRPIEGQYDTWSLDGNLLLRKPRDLYLVGRAFTDPQFGLHSNDTMYWLWIKPEASTEYRGAYGGPGAERFVMRPDYLLQSLAIYPLPEDMWTFRRDDARDALVIIGIDVPAMPESDPAAATVMPWIRQETYLDHIEHDPREVRLYDKRGELLVVSTLNGYRAVSGVRLPTELEYRFIPADATFRLQLKDVELNEPIKDGVFDHDRVTPELQHVIDLDAPEPR